ncbi:spermidine synthase [Legionella sp. CNM-1927-20]|uniref:spermidine synthase n=1 Tax=Legionella sp. CNM-1927-20 TaxID=3422221 RepID=UPI00403A8BE5
MLWQTLAGRCIYRSDHIRVYDNYFFRWLKFNSNAFQSLINKLTPSRPALNYVKALTFAARQRPGNCCMLGLGGAGVAHALAPLLQSYTLTAVEMNSEVIDVARRYFMLERLTNLTVIQEEASAFMAHCQQTFRHLLIDIADANDFPASCKNKDFFLNCQRILSSQGILAINIANAYEHQFIFTMLKHQFASSIITLPVKRCVNIIFMATHKDNFNSLLGYFNQSNEVKQLVWDQKWGYIAYLHYDKFF